MESWDIRLIGASYKKIADSHLMIELYGKTRSGNTITVRYPGFEPYFYIGEPTESLVKEMESSPDVRRVERDELFYDGQFRQCIRVIVNYPWLIPDIRNKYRAKFKLFSADIPFHHRFLYDLDIQSCVRVYGEKGTGKYTTDLVVDAERFEDIKPFNPPLKILSFDIETSVRHSTIYSICYCVLEDGEIKYGRPIYGEEKSIIESFNAVIADIDPDVITGYNINNFDIPRIIERGVANGIEHLNWGRDYNDPRSINGKFWRVNGRLIADAWYAAKVELHPKRETLNFVSKLLFNEEKLDVNPAKMDEEWANDKMKVLKYCLKDAELAVRILDKVGAIRKAMDVATVSKLPLDDVLNVGNSNLIDSLLIREVDRNRIGVPLTRRDEESEGTIEGAYVHQIEAGLFRWVCVLDFKSMYPSIVITKNICFSTQSPEGEIVSPIGAKFISPDKRPGIMSGLLKDLMGERDNTKRKMKETEDADEKNYYDGLQGAIKILMNAFYGVFASSFYRFTDNNIGGSVTGFAREITKGIITSCQSKGLRVIYSDTDSVFIQSPYTELEETIKFGNDLAEKFSYNTGIPLQFEKIINPLFSHGKKKRYIGTVVWPEETTVVRGYEIRRTDSFDLQSETLSQIFDNILKGDAHECLEIARRVVRETQDGKIPLDKLVISKGCRPFAEYVKPESQASVQTAKKLMSEGYEFIPGMKVSWIVVDGGTSPQKVEPYIAGKEFKYKPDYTYYSRRIANTLARATEAFGWTESDLLQNNRQTTLFGEDRKARMREKEWGVKKVDKELKLEDFQ